MTRIRSPGYPSSPLSEAIDFTNKLFEKNRRNATDREAAVKDLGFSGVSGHSAKILSNLSHFGLIEKQGKGGVRVTELAVRIIHPKSDDDRKAALREAAFAPELFQEIQTNWPDGFVSENSLRSYLMREGFASVAIGPIIRSYQDTYGFLRQEGATESYGAKPEGGEELPPEKASNVLGPPLSAVAAPAITTPAAPSASEGVKLMVGERIVFVEESGPGRYVKLVASGEIDGGLLEALEDYVKRLKRRVSMALPSGPTDSNSPELPS